MDEIRWILLIVGVLVVAGVYGYTRWQDVRKHGGRRRARRDSFGDDVDIDTALDELDSVIAERDTVDLSSRPQSTPEAHDDWEIRPVVREPRGPREVEPELEAEEAPAGEVKVIVLNVAATDGRHFSGEGIVAALESVGMRLGDHDIYHRTLDTRSGPVSLFSAANILKPGTLRPEDLAQIHSPGIAMFLQLPGPSDGLAAFEQMLDAARRIAEQLNVKLLDGSRCTLSNQAIEHIREELREYRRRAHLASKKTTI